MKCFRIQLKGSNAGIVVPGDTIKYTREFLNVKTGSTITSQYLRTDTQGWSLEVSSPFEGIKAKRREEQSKSQRRVIGSKRKTSPEAFSIQ